MLNGRDGRAVMVIPVLNGYDLLDRTLASVDDDRIKEILIIDNGGHYTDLVENFSRSYELKILNLPSNLGVAGSWNLGIKLYPHEPFVIFGSHDNGWIPGELTRLIDESSECHMVVTDPEPYATFSLGRDIVRLVGLFDENFYPAYYEDTDYTRRITRMGFASLIKRPGIKMNFYSHGTTRDSSPEFYKRDNFTIGENHGYFHAKEELPVDEQNSMKWQIDRRIRNEWLT